MIFSETYNYHPPFVPIIHSADCLFAARTNFAGELVPDTVKLFCCTEEVRYAIKSSD
jgi:hypothetical protein